MENILSSLSDFDRNSILYYLSSFREIALTENNFESYLKFSINKLSTNLTPSDIKVLSLAFGLFENSEWPINILSSTLNIEENEMESLINEIVTKLINNNKQKIIPAINYYQCNKDKIVSTNGYIRLLENIIVSL